MAAREDDSGWKRLDSSRGKMTTEEEAVEGEGSGDMRLLRQERRNGRLQYPARVAAEESDKGLANGDNGREAWEEDSDGGEREMVANSRSRGRKRAWLRQRRLRQREEKAARFGEEEEVGEQCRYWCS
ncbi:hypothetical protein B296_00043897 [Ensete ventricosum]|uniref:Uncharacterized protein n=1 Tax=Ensete ventricosum TaxID=4639 RepID=A0A426X4I3_ENSVE|nr:hypothetical protein B296_00043897 [Ensete ventricosum]